MQPFHNPLPCGSNPEWNPGDRCRIGSCCRLCSMVSTSCKYNYCDSGENHMNYVATYNDWNKQERVTATSISQMLNNVGQGVNIKPTFYNCTISHHPWFPKVSFLIASLMVDEPSHSPTHHVNATSNNASLVASEVTKLKVVLPFQSSHSLFTKFSFQVRVEIEHYLLLLSVPAIITFLMAALYFPSKPPTPPSNSAKVNKSQHADCRVWHISLSRKLVFLSSLEQSNFWEIQTLGQSLLSGPFHRYWVDFSFKTTVSGGLEQLVCSHGYFPDKDFSWRLKNTKQIVIFEHQNNPNIFLYEQVNIWPRGGFPISDFLPFLCQPSPPSESVLPLVGLGLFYYYVFT